MVFVTDSVGWQPLRLNQAKVVYGKILQAEGTQVMLVQVEPGGGFLPHRDGYGHMFCFLAGCGIVRFEESELAVRPGMMVQVAAGESHSYENTGGTDLTLISLNLPSS
jgi:mannose-6-phosphate isomerase-like protein (cupin superfamily)